MGGRRDLNTPTAAIFNTHVRDNLNFLRQDYFYTEKTTNSSVTSTSETAPDLIVTSGSQTYDGAKVLIEFFTPYVSLAAVNLVLSLWDGTTNLGFLAEIDATSDGPVHAARRLTPTAAAHEYRVRGWNRAAGTNSVSGGAGGAANFLPMYIRITW